MIRFLKYSINIPTPMNINIKLVNCTGEARSYHIKVNEKKKKMGSLSLGERRNGIDIFLLPLLFFKLVHVI